MNIGEFGRAGGFDGLRVFVIEDTPKYALPVEVMPGVPWPVGFRDDFNAWSARRLGVTNLMPDGEVLASGAFGGVWVNPRTYDRVKKAMS